MKICGGLRASSGFNWIFSLILITTCCFKAAFSECGSECPQNYDPICGSDGRTYGNDCEMNVASCRSQTGVTMVHKGRCRKGTTTERSCDLVCSANYDPVCGSDGTTYPNECGMNAANCRSETRITMVHRGRCSQGTTTERSCDLVCLANYDPVCGSDGTTYGNECGMNAANCRSETRITMVHRGRCSQGRTTERSCGLACPANYDPVCGSDGTTYPNECELLRSRCMKKKRLRVACKGVCRRSRSRRLTCRNRPRATLQN